MRACRSRRRRRWSSRAASRWIRIRSSLRSTRRSAADSLVKQRIKVPGGLIGLVDTGGFSGLLISLFNAAVASVNDVYATANWCSAKFDYFSFIIGSWDDARVADPDPSGEPVPGLELLHRVVPGTPVRLKLTVGTTAPPLPNTPITGSVGTITQNSGGTVTNGDGRQPGRQRVLGPRGVELRLPAARHAGHHGGGQPQGRSSGRRWQEHGDHDRRRPDGHPHFGAGRRHQAPAWRVARRSVRNGLLTRSMVKRGAPKRRPSCV